KLTTKLRKITTLMKILVLPTIKDAVDDIPTLQFPGGFKFFKLLFFTLL
ncbi:24272_t:CDS:1, partial [Racocetra persica]